MSKRYSIPVHEVERVEVTEEIFAPSAHEWPSVESLQEYVDGVVAMMPEVRPASKRRVSKMVLSDDGRSGFATWETIHSGVPHLEYDEGHIDDIGWSDPVISRRFLAGPSWANDNSLQS